LLSYIFGARPAMILTAPVIYALIIPVLLLDLFVAVYPDRMFPGVWDPTRSLDRLPGIRPRAARLPQRD
jgi:hypothetical protein